MQERADARRQKEEEERRLKTEAVPEPTPVDIEREAEQQAARHRQQQADTLSAEVAASTARKTDELLASAKSRDPKVALSAAQMELKAAMGLNLDATAAAARAGGGGVAATPDAQAPKPTPASAQQPAGSQLSEVVDQVFVKNKANMSSTELVRAAQVMHDMMSHHERTQVAREG